MKYLEIAWQIGSSYNSSYSREKYGEHGEEIVLSSFVLSVISIHVRPKYLRCKEIEEWDSITYVYVILAHITSAKETWHCKIYNKIALTVVAYESFSTFFIVQRTPEWTNDEVDLREDQYEK